MGMLKRRLHGADDWMMLALGNSMTILQQNFKKSKSFRRSKT